MESNITEQQHFNNDLQLSEPHFDQEATVLSARPVVPLQDIKAEVSIGRRLAFGLSILVSLMVGALGATLIYKQRGQKSATSVVETAVAGSGASAQNSAVTEASTGEVGKEVAQPEVQNAGSVDENNKPWSKSAPRAERSGPQVRRVESTKPKPAQRTIAHVDERDSRLDEREMRADRIEVRRFRRRAERESQKEARPHRSKSADDLLRIREIFEGSPRP